MSWSCRQYISPGSGEMSAVGCYITNHDDDSSGGSGT
jgi:hypothetical protein